MNGKKARAMRRAERLHSPVPPTIDQQLDAHSARVAKWREDLRSGDPEVVKAAEGHAPMTLLKAPPGTDTMLVTVASVVSALMWDPGSGYMVFTSSYERAVDLTYAILKEVGPLSRVRLFPCQIVIAEEFPDGRRVVRVMPPWANTAEDAMQKSRVLILVPVNERTPILIVA